MDRPDVPKAGEGQEMLLFRPQGAPESLLGREVFKKGKRYLIASERNPGCRVRPRRILESWHRDYREELEKSVGIGADVPRIGKLKAKYGKEASVAFVVTNSVRLEADIEGNCGRVFVRDVRVGTGERYIGNKSDVELAVHAAVKGVEAGAGAGRKYSQIEKFSWNEEQAWSFSVGTLQDSQGLGCETRLFLGDKPAEGEFREGDEFVIRTTCKRDAWLLMMGREHDGRLFKMVPNETYHQVEVTANVPKDLPPVRAELRGATTMRERTMFVFAFSSKELWNEHKWPEGILSTAVMQKWFNETKEELENRPRRQWERKEIHYRVMPDPSLAANAEPAPTRDCSGKGPCMVAIEGGSFQMGSDRASNERPIHEVRVPSFWMNQTEVTVGHYRECVDDGVCASPRTGGRDAAAYNWNQAGRDQHPINGISLPQAEAFCAWAGARLPSEEEWEYAARGPRGAAFPWGNQNPSPIRLNACDQACRDHASDKLSKNFQPLFASSDEFAMTAPVGSYPAGQTPTRLDDLAGNVAEWTNTNACPYEQPDCSEPKRVIRGGSWTSSSNSHVSSTHRESAAPNVRHYNLGFRCAR